LIQLLLDAKKLPPLFLTLSGRTGFVGSNMKLNPFVVNAKTRGNT
jgi:hypothetical protein